MGRTRPSRRALPPRPHRPRPLPRQPSSAGAALSKKYACIACHGIDSKIVGPGFREIARKYAGRADGVDYLAGKIVAGGTGVWGAIPMPPQTLSG
jgi:S-disulfanyl-L-cysteine oxidoreductase SoxD